ncbi:DUF2799 domain-containing protein [Vibrio sp.]|uniref:DUF2799 domain-containing protein n=1 Tax=Vibrio sp. TaxID=678 RepID=UPI003D1229BB
MKWLKIALAVGVLSGCSATPQQMAQQGDWYQIGYQDGVSGHTRRSYSKLAELGDVDQADYDQGYTKGVSEYCNPDFAYQMGLSGMHYEGVCEGTEQAQKFRMEWQRGWNQYKN